MADQVTARQQNEQACLALLRDSGSLSTTELMERTQLSRPTVDAIARTLESAGVVMGTIRPADGAGRPAKVYRFVPEQVVVGVEIGQATTRAVCANRAGALIASHESPRTAGDEGTPAESIEQILADIEAATLTVAGGRELAGLGLALPGILDGQHVALSRVLPALNDADVVELLEQRLGVPVRIGNDVKLAGLGEARAGAGRDTASMVLLWLGRRVSTSVVVDGAVFQGAHGLAGEITAAAGTEWTQGSTYGAWGWPHGWDGLETGRRAAAGELEARSALTDYLRDIARPLARLTAIIDPHRVVLSGVLSETSAPIATMLRSQIADRLTVPFVPEMVTARHGRFSSALGGVVTAFDDPRISTVDRWLLPVPYPALSIPPPPS